MLPGSLLLLLLLLLLLCFFFFFFFFEVNQLQGRNQATRHSLLKKDPVGEWGNLLKPHPTAPLQAGYHRAM
jgi:hypothetical protein